MAGSNPWLVSLDPRSLLRSLVPSGSLGERAIKSGVWVSLLTVFDRIFVLSTYVLLARLLSPTAFGVLGLALLAVTLSKRLTKPGLSQAFVQRDPTDAAAYLNTAWVVAICRGLVVAVAGFAVAPVAADLLSTPALSPVLRVLVFTVLVRGFRNPGVIVLRKSLDFHYEALYQASGTVTRVVVSLCVALVWPTVWALVAGHLAAAVAQTVASYRVHDFRPRPIINADAARDMFAFGKWIFGSGLLLFGLNRGDDVAVGWLLGPAALGLYQFAFRLSNAPATEITHVISRVAFPAFATTEDDTARLREGYVRTFRFVVLLALPMATGIVLVAPAFVAGVLGPDWVDMVPAMRVLAVWGFIRALAALCGPLFQAIDHPEYSTAMQLSRLLVLAVFIYPATTRWGIAGAAMAVVGSAVLQTPVAIALAVRVIDASPTRLLGTLVSPTAATIPMVATVLLAGTLPIGPILRFVVMALVGMGTYVSALLVYERTLGIGLDRDLATVREAFG